MCWVYQDPFLWELATPSWISFLWLLLLHLSQQPRASFNRLILIFLQYRLEKGDSLDTRPGISLSGIGFGIKANHFEGQAKVRLIGANCRPRCLQPTQLDKSVGKRVSECNLNSDIKDKWSLFSLVCCCSSETEWWMNGNLATMQSKLSSIDTTKI